MAALSEQRATGHRRKKHLKEPVTHKKAVVVGLTCWTFGQINKLHDAYVHVVMCYNDLELISAFGSN